MNMIAYLIDDDGEDRDLFCMALKNVRKEVECLALPDGEKALDRLLKPGAVLPFVIFLDINMPGRNGWHYLQKIKEQEAFAHIPVVMYSTSATMADKERSVNNGALGLLTKPDDLDLLETYLDAICTLVETGIADAAAFKKHSWLYTGA